MADERFAGLASGLGEDAGAHAVGHPGAEEQEAEGEGHVAHDQLAHRLGADARAEEGLRKSKGV